MRFIRQNKKRRAPTVIIVSLIDVLLVVMIFLMVSTTLKNDPPAVKLSLPESAQAKPGAAETQPVVISISSNAPYFFLQERPVTVEHLGLTTSATVEVKDAAKAANVGGVSLIAEKPPVR